MKKIVFLSLSIFFWFGLSLSADQNLSQLEVSLEQLSGFLTIPAQDSKLTISQLKSLLDFLPEMPGGRMPLDYSQAVKSDGAPIVPLAVLEKAFDSVAQVIKNQQNDPALWFDKKELPANLYDVNAEIDIYEKTFFPFAQSLVIKDDSEVAFWGDLHGSGQSLVNDLAELIQRGYLRDDFSVIRNNFYMLFLGDYTDRGAYGAEVLYMLLRLKIANPDHVYMVRGNHEDMSLVGYYGFINELQTKYGKKQIGALKTKIFNFFNLLPVVLYLGSGGPQIMNFIQCNHGGLELGFDPSDFLERYSRNRFALITHYDRQKNLKKLQNPALEQKILETFARYPSELKNQEPWSTSTPTAIGYMWNDFSPDPKKGFYYTDGRGWAYDQELAENLLDWPHTAYKNIYLNAIIRAHQHSDSMPNFLQKRGAYPIWNGKVYTLLSAIGMFGASFPYDTFSMLKIAPNYNQWILTHWWRQVTQLGGPFGRKVESWQEETTLLSRGMFG